MPARKTRRAALGVAGLGAAMTAGLLGSAGASSHREGPYVAFDPQIDATDTYAFVSPDAPDTVTLIGNWIPLEFPGAGPEYYRFDEDALYEFEIDNDGDSITDMEFEFRFHTEFTKDTITYATGQVTSIDDPDLAVVQSYSVALERDGHVEVIAEGLLTPPPNIGVRTTPDYEALAEQAIHELPHGIKVFAGQRDDSFFIDVAAAFDLLGLPPLNPAHAIPLPAEEGQDSLAGLNVHTIAIQVPTELLLNEEKQPIIGVWSSTYRRQQRVLGEGGPEQEMESGPWVRVSRLGNPLVNEVIIPRTQKDRFNSSEPRNDAQFLPFVLDPEIARLIPALYPVLQGNLPAAPRNDLATIFLTGIPGLNQPEGVVPAELLRLNTSIMPSGSANPLGVLGGDTGGFPNGRRLADDVTDIELRAVAGATPLTPEFQRAPNNALTDGVSSNDRPFLDRFPYVATPWPGYDPALRDGGAMAQP